MTDTPYKRKRDFFGTVSGEYRVRAGTNGLVALVASLAGQTTYVQTVHIEVTTSSGGELWTLQDAAGVPIVPNVSAAAVAHFDFDFGPDGVPADGLVLNVTGAIGALGVITWEAYRTVTIAGTGPSYGAVVLADRPTNWWRLNERSGLTALDSMGGANGTISGGVTLNQPGPLIDGTPAMTFDGVNGQIVTSAISLPLACTIELWAKTSYAGGYRPMLTIRPEDTFQLAIPNAPDVGKVRVWTGVFSMGARLINDGRWHHLAIGLTGAACLITVDSVLDTNTPNARIAQAGPLKIGVDSVDNNFWQGGLADVAIYNYVLSPAQIAKHYTAGVSR